MPYTLIIAEKPSVGRDIARCLGVRGGGDGVLGDGDMRVSWAFGHLVTLAEPDTIDPKYKRWTMGDLPMLPAEIPLAVVAKSRPQFMLLKKLMNAKDCEKIIVATDAGREGELIFRYIYHAAGCKKPFDRLWVSSMTDAAIQEAFAHIKPGAAYDGLYDSARCRAIADWEVGMNATRAFTLRYNTLLSVGRVQTPTLALLVDRKRAIDAFQSVPYWVVTADFGDYTGVWQDTNTAEKRVYDEATARAIAKRTQKQPARVARVEHTEKREYSQPLYDLTALQRDANRVLGLPAAKTLSIAQDLYEKYKLLTYPRTDSRHLPHDMMAKAHTAIKNLPSPYDVIANPLREKLPSSPRVFDDAKITDHHAIIPTDMRASLATLPPELQAVYDLVARRFLSVFYPPYVYTATVVDTVVKDEHFISTGRTVLDIGYRACLPPQDKEDAPLPPLTQGDARTAESVHVKKEQTKPPAPHTEATLLFAMEHAGRDVSDEALADALKARGLGTPATRAAIIERLIRVGYIERKKRDLLPTEKGVKLIDAVPDDIKSAETTGRWEQGLKQIEAGEITAERFLAGIGRLCTALVAHARDGKGVGAFPVEVSQAKKRVAP